MVRVAILVAVSSLVYVAQAIPVAVVIGLSPEMDRTRALLALPYFASLEYIVASLASGVAAAVTARADPPRLTPLPLALSGAAYVAAIAVMQAFGLYAPTWSPVDSVLFSVGTGSAFAAPVMTAPVLALLILVHRRRVERGSLKRARQ